ncbi:D-3-phosphoglycerate dehydrogenase [Phycisphaerae bacterium RAS1]|nr:D-3-phosphoglycerate dehydrogenase [Phycisphaerae bacterium RAS1]
MYQMKTVYITDFWTGAPDVEQDALAGVAAVVALGEHDEKKLLPRIADADGLLVWHDIRISAATLAALTRCRVLVRIGVGFDNVDLEAARSRDIVVCNTPDYGIEDVADHAIAMMLALLKNLPQFNHDLKQAAPLLWNARRNARMPRLRGMVFGVIGLGRIGSATALRAKAFGMDVVAFDPYIPDGRDKALGIRMAYCLDELLRQSDVVSIHTPLNETTRGMISAPALAQFKRGATLINTARGPVCDTTALLAALESGQLAGAGLDVLPVEPPNADDPLIIAVRDPSHVAHYRCILSPHAAFYTEEGFIEMRRKAALEVRRALTGERVRNRVN